MTEITCPVCGKLNPAEAETCWNCLSPLSGESAPPSHPTEPDWLSGLRSDTTPAESDSTNIPDWLSRIRQRQEEDEATQSALLGNLGGPAESQDDDTVPDWLAGLTGMPIEEPAPAAPAEETPDWLAGLTTPEAPAEPGASAVEPLLTEPGGETPDWLAGFSASAAPVEPGESPFSLGPTEGEQPSEPTSEGPDWLAGLAAEAAAGLAESPEEALPAGSAAEIPAEPAEALPDWLSRLTSSELPPETAEGISPAAELPAEPAEITPEWLADLAAGAPSEPIESELPAEPAAELPAEPAAELPAEPAEITPEWLADLAAGAPSEPIESELSAELSAELPAEPAAELPAEPAAEPAAELPAEPAAELLAEPAEITPEWLADLAASAPSEPIESELPAEPAAELPAEPAEITPEWLADLAASAPFEPIESEMSAELPAEPAAELPAEPAAELPAEPEAELPAEPAEITPEWLADLAAGAPSEPIESELPAEPAAELPAEPAAEPAAELPAEPAEITPEWLADLAAGAPSEPIESELPSEPAAELPAEPAEITPEWLADLAASAPSEPIESELPAEPAAELPAEPAEITPEWLADLAAGAPSEPIESELPAEPAAELPAEPTEITPEWLAGLTAGAPSEPIESELPAEPAEITPEWLAGLAGAADLEPEETRAGEVPLDYTQLPESGISSDVFTGEEAEELSEAGAGTGIPPEWLGSSAPPTLPGAAPTWIELFTEQPKPGEAEAVPPTETPAPFAESGAELDWLNAPPSSAEPEPPPRTSLPDWLSMGEVAPEEEQAPAEGEPAPGEARPGEGIPAWLAAIAPEGVLPPEGPEPSAPAFDESASLQSAPNLTTPFDSAESTDWLSQAQPPVEEGAGAGEPVPSAPLAPALMPAWLQAMRPVEASTPTGVPEEPDNQPIEQAGPLKGLQGLLPGSRTATAYSKPAIYSSKLQVTDSQRQHTELFESLLESAANPSLARAAAVKPSRSPLRWMIGLLLILTVLIPLLASSQQAVLPLTFPSELVTAHQILSGLPDSAPVLLAVEYEAGLSGEMRTAAAPVMDQLLAKNARLTLLSTVPSGPVLARQLLEAAQSAQPGYDPASQTVNLGYLAGENTGLRQFALNPQLAAPYTLDQMPAWSAPALQNVQNLSDFAAVVVITDNFDIARNWIEQVQPSLGSTPLLMVTSAQIQALVQPYTQSGQVKGQIAGLPGSAMYEQLQQKPGQTRIYWDAYQSGMLVIAVLLLLGAFYQVLTSLTRRKKPAKGR